MSGDESQIYDVVKSVTKVRRKRKVWVSKWILSRTHRGDDVMPRLKEPTNEIKTAFCDFIRIDVRLFDELLEKIRPKIQKQSTLMRDAIPAYLKLQVTLHYLATGESLSSLQYVYRVPKNTISFFLPEVLDAIYDDALGGDYLETPKTAADWQKIADGFQTNWNFPNCVGIVDGRHIPIKNTRNITERCNVVLLALVDDRYRFTCIDVGAYGDIGCPQIYERSALCLAIEENELNIPEGSILIAGTGFPLREYLMTPYMAAANDDDDDDGGGHRRKERIYNGRHRRAYNVAENAFGVLAARWRILHKDMVLKPHKVVKIIKAACAMHNWMREHASDDHDLTVDHEDRQHGLVMVDGSWRSAISSFSGIKCLAPTREDAVRGTPEGGETIRDSIAEYFMAEGAVDWQWKFNYDKIEDY